uniref:Uncharacterized protein TCIL3000_9_6220 n=1 Tax=Trypanosoma congolense (strain IL3000) TaxID=1068625 RepID=G0UUZ6_TRYCI|nr:unnamed protein product [Trypanosoma congolense IL3000]
MAENTGKECIIQFRAGKMILDGKLVVADEQKGMLSFSKDPEGIVMCWTSKSHSERHILIPGQVKFSRVEKCSTGRVFVLDFGDAKPAMFFWLQEKSTENDEVYFTLIQEALSISPQNFLKSEGLSGKGYNSLCNNLSGAGEQDVELASVVGSVGVLNALREDPDFFMCRLHQFLPVGTDPKSDIVEHVINPQVAAAATSLEMVLRNPGGFHNLCMAFDIKGEVAGVLGFLNGLLEYHKE